MMQTLGLLGLNIAGNKKALNNKGTKRSERAQYLNPKGFYEIPGTVMKGIKTEDLDKYKGKVIKIITPGMVKTLQSDEGKAALGKLIFCMRHPKEIAVSQRKLASAVEVAGDDGWKYLPEVLPASPTRYVKAISWLVLWVQKHKEIWENAFRVDYEHMLTNPAQAIQEIIDFLEIIPTEEQVQEAIGNIDTSLYRSLTDSIEWEDAEGGALAEKLYKGISTGTMEHITEDMITTIGEMIVHDRLENARWLDDVEFNTWTRMAASLWRAVETNNNEVRDNLQKSAIRRHQQWSTKCAYYNNDGEEYTVYRPDDLGHLTRNKVQCDYHKEDKTREECYRCWNEIINGRKLP